MTHSNSTYVRRRAARTFVEARRRAFARTRLAPVARIGAVGKLAASLVDLAAQDQLGLSRDAGV